MSKYLNLKQKSQTLLNSKFINCIIIFCKGKNKIIIQFENKIHDSETINPELGNM